MSPVQVWIAAARRGIHAHALAARPESTGCDRSTRAGLILDAADAITRHQVTWCPTCWPDGGPTLTATETAHVSVDGAAGADTDSAAPAPVPTPSSSGVGAGVTPTRSAPLLPPTYVGWRNVPAGLMTKTELSRLDLPRVPGGPIRAHVEAYNWRDKKELMALYSVTESTPSPASIAQLEAARARSGDGRVCDGCGARPDRPCSGGPAGWWCRACARLRALRAAIEDAGRRRTEAAQWAAGVLDPAVPPAVVLHVRQIFRPPAPSGRQNPEPIAVQVDAVDATGARLVDATVRLAGPRVRAVPVDAVAPATVAEPIRALLAAPVIVTWTTSAAWILQQLYGPAAPASWYGGNPNDLGRRATDWRSDVDPDSLTARAALHPGNAERMLLILRRMAATAAPGGPR